MAKNKQDQSVKVGNANSRAKYKNTISRAKKVRKRQEAEERQAKYDSLTTKEKLKRAVGKREIAKLKARLLKETKVETPIAPVTPELTNVKLTLTQPTKTKTVRKKAKTKA